MRKLATAAAVTAVLIVLPGCKPAEEYLRKAAEIAAAINAALVTTRGKIEAYCGQIAALEPQVVGIAVAAGVDMNSCKAATVLVRERAFVASVCTGLDKLTDAIAGNYLRNVQAGWSRASTAVANGC